MRSRLFSNPQDAAHDVWTTTGDLNSGATIQTPLAGLDRVSNFHASKPASPVLPEESVQAAAAVTGSGPGGVGSSVSVTSSSGFTINLIYDAAAMAAPASFRAGIEQAAAILSATISNKITININIDYSGTGGGAFGGPSGGQFISYPTVRGDLIADAAPNDTSFNALPTSSTIQGQSQVVVWNAQLKLLGLLSPTATGADGNASFATDINPNLLVGVALHELTHAMGRVPYGQPDGPQPDIFDFYRFTSAGTRLFTDNMPAAPSYFSLNGGTTKLADFGVSSDPSDFLNSGAQGGTDPFDEFYTSSTLQTLTAVDKQILDALGFNTLIATKVIQTDANSLGTTNLTQVGSNYFLYNGSGVGPELKYQGSPVTSGEFGAVTPIGAALTASGYEVAWHFNGTNNYTVWNADSSGNFVSDTLGIVPGNNTTLELLEASFNQDINGDGVIGIPIIQTDTNSFGTVVLTQVANNYYLYNTGGVGPELKYTSAPVTVGEFGAVTPMGAALTASGYEVAWHFTGTNNYTVWNTDSSGNFVSDTIGIVAGNNTVLETLETSFQQDINGDGFIGVVTPIQTAANSFGTTTLNQFGNNYYLSNSTGTGPELKYQGSPVTTGEFGAVAPVGAAQTASGYEVAWHFIGTNNYTIWNTDSNGNYVSDTIGMVPGNSTTLETLEASFNQDINGDGVIGVTATQTVAASHALVSATSDNFQFRTNMGSENMALADHHAASTEMPGLDNSQFAALLNENQAGASHFQFDAFADGHGAPTGHVNHGSGSSGGDHSAHHFFI